MRKIKAKCAKRLNKLCLNEILPKYVCAVQFKTNSLCHSISNEKDTLVVTRSFNKFSVKSKSATQNLRKNSEEFNHFRFCWHQIPPSVYTAGSMVFIIENLKLATIFFIICNSQKASFI